MKTLINNLKTIFETAISNSEITKANTVFKGIHEDPEKIPFNLFNYIALDDGGERVEESGSSTAQNRFYSVIIEMGVYSTNRDNSLDDVLDLSNEVKTVLEKQTNRQKDSHVWGINITTFAWETEMYFYRGRTVVVDFIELEDKYFDY